MGKNDITLKDYLSDPKQSKSGRQALFWHKKRSALYPNIRFIF